MKILMLMLCSWDTDDGAAEEGVDWRCGERPDC